MEDTRVLPRVVGREPVSCGDQTGREARQPESHTDFRGQHGLGSEQLLQPYHTWGCLGFRGKGLTTAGGCTLRLPVTQGASDWEGSPPDHSSGDLGLAGTTRIAEPGLRPRLGLCLEGSLVSSPGVGGLLASLGLQDVKAPLCFHNHRHVGFGDWGAHQAQPSIYRRGADPKVPLGREPLPGGGRGFDAEGKGGLQGSPEGQAAPGVGVRPTRHPAPSTRGPLTDVGVLQEAADPSLSLQLLVIWGQKKPGVASSPAARHPHAQGHPGHRVPERSAPQTRSLGSWPTGHSSHLGARGVSAGPTGELTVQFISQKLHISSQQRSQHEGKSRWRL